MMRLVTSVLSVPFLTAAVWASGPTLEGSWDIYPTWWPVGAVATALLLLVLFGWALLHLLPLALAIVASVLGIRWLIGATGARRSDSAVGILRERYARGEIGKEEFDAKLRDLGGPP